MIPIKRYFCNPLYADSVLFNLNNSGGLQLIIEIEMVQISGKSENKEALQESGLPIETVSIDITENFSIFVL